MIVNMPNKEGVTLATQGKYCKENIKVVPTFSDTLNDYLLGTKTDITAEDLAGVTEIRDYAFYHSPITSVEIPNGITYIGVGAFYLCSHLSGELTIPDTVITLGDVTFRETAIVLLVIGNGVTSIPVSMLEKCTNLTSVEMGDNVKSIGRAAFFGCTSLASITIPNSVTSIDDTAFANCKSITSINIPNSVTYIGNDAFSGCSNLSKVYINDIEAWCGIGFYSHYSNPLRYGALYLNGEEVTELIIPNSITKINGSAFDGCKSITSVTIPSGVTSIGYSAFYQCSNLVKVTCLAETPPVIQNDTFNGVPADCIFEVPAASVEAYKAAPNWIARADYIVAKEGT